MSIWLLTIKCRESPRFIFAQVACHIPLESSWRGLQLSFRPHLNQRLVEEIVSLQSCGSPNFGNFRIPNLGVPGQNNIWVLALWLGTENTTKGKMVASPKSRLWWLCESMFARGKSVHQKCSNYALTNLLFGLCKFVWIIDLLVTLPNPHPGVAARPSTPKMLRVRERAPTPFPFIFFTFGFVVASIKESRGESSTNWNPTGS